MALSYSLRLVCLALCSFGLIHVAAEMLLWALAPSLLRLVAALSTRRQELALYFLQLIPTALALSATLFAYIPDYLLHETNFASEHVGWLCLACAATVSLWLGVTLYRGLRVMIETALFTRACRRNGEYIQDEANGTPILTFCEQPHRLALIGLLRPFILISSSLVEQGGLDPLALEIVLDHERAHAAQRDNWKLLTLYWLPRLTLRSKDGQTWMQRWRNAAECAADDDAVRGESERALLLAETLVAFSRRNSAPQPSVACTPLVCGETDLVARVERLIEQAPFAASKHNLRGALLLCSSLLGGAAILAMLLPMFGDLPEHILHLG